MYLPVTSGLMKYYLNNCGIKLTMSHESLTVTSNVYSIVLNRPGDSVKIGLTFMEENKKSILFTDTDLTPSNRRKEICNKIGFTEVMILGLVKYAKRYNKEKITIITDNDLLVEIMVDVGFSLIPTDSENTRKYKGTMCLSNGYLLPF